MTYHIACVRAVHLNTRLPVASMDPIHVLRGHLGDVQSLSYLSEDHLYAGDSHGDLRLWDLASCRTEYTARLHDANSGILHLACLPEYGILLSQGRDGCVKLWAAGRTCALDRPTPLQEIRTGSFNFCRCAVWAPALASPRGTPGPQPLDSRPAAPAAAGTAHPLGAGPAGDPRDLLLACAGHDPADVNVWRPAEAPSISVRLCLSEGINSGAETKHGMCMALAFLSPSPAPPHRETGMGTGEGGRNDLEPLDEQDSSTCGGGDVDSSGNKGAASDPRFIIAGYEDGVVALWDLRKPGRPLGSLRAHTEPVMCLDVRARVQGRSKGNGGTALGAGRENDSATEIYDLVSGSADDKISCCEVRPGTPQPVTLTKQLPLREGGTSDVQIRSDSKLFACGCWDGRVRLFSVRRREPLAVLKVRRMCSVREARGPLTRSLLPTIAYLRVPPPLEDGA
ncbi:hypothetical protein Vafri_8637 [Volvox africanus]|uniref:Uncharacterized protein n=2 Tax=Volvox africanus TaxID=51714 RepID=A0A8J4B3B4_9CHLO|nr:hypothetical protein Vafri_8637 [Volvox africanus]